MEVFVLVMTLYGQPKGTPVVTAQYPSAEACEAAATRASWQFRLHGYKGKLVYVCDKQTVTTAAELRERS